MRSRVFSATWSSVVVILPALSSPDFRGLGHSRAPGEAGAAGPTVAERIARIQVLYRSVCTRYGLAVFQATTGWLDATGLHVPGVEGSARGKDRLVQESLGPMDTTAVRRQVVQPETGCA